MAPDTRPAGGVFGSPTRLPAMTYDFDPWDLKETGGLNSESPCVFKHHASGNPELICRGSTVTTKRSSHDNVSLMTKGPSAKLNAAND